MRTTSKEQYLQAAQLFDWAIREHYTLWFKGSTENRDRRTEVMLPRLVKKGKLQGMKYGTRMVYSALRINRRIADQYVRNIEHGLGVTEGLVRVWRSRMDGLIIPERFFHGLGSIPEWGIKYPGGTLLLYEFCTFDNFYQRLRYKLNCYNANLSNIEEEFDGKAVVLFVLDVERLPVELFIQRHHPPGPFFFTDYKTFKGIPIGEQLHAVIYLWGENGQPYSLEGRHVD